MNTSGFYVKHNFKSKSRHKHCIFNNSVQNKYISLWLPRDLEAVQIAWLGKQVKTKLITLTKVKMGNKIILFVTNQKSTGCRLPNLSRWSPSAGLSAGLICLPLTRKGSVCQEPFGIPDWLLFLREFCPYPLKLQKIQSFSGYAFHWLKWLLSEVISRDTLSHLNGSFKKPIFQTTLRPKPGRDSVTNDARRNLSDAEQHSWARQHSPPRRVRLS